LRSALGCYRADLARLFFGLDSPEHAASGGRLAAYRGNPPLSDAAFHVLRRLAAGAVAGLEVWAQCHLEPWRPPEAFGPEVLQLTRLTLEEIVTLAWDHGEPAG
jgi:hypothetical protein